MLRTGSNPSAHYSQLCLSWLASVAILLLSACAANVRVAPAPPGPALLYPAAPDSPRFVFERSIRSSADVVAESEQSSLMRALTGTGFGVEALAKPYAIAAYRGRILVSDSVERFVKVFDVARGRYYKIGDGNGEGVLAKPLGLSVDAQGMVYVADATAKFVYAYDIDGRFQRKIAGPGFFDRLTSVTVSPDGSLLYAVDIGGVNSELHRVRVFNALTGAHLFDIGRRGNGPGEFNFPRDVAIGTQGRLYVVDGGNFRVQVFDRDGKYLSSFGSVGKQPGNFARPKEIATDRSGNVYVADTAFGNFQIFSAQGELLMFIGERAETAAPGQYMLPSGIAVDEDGRVLFVDQWFRKIDVFRPYALKASEGELVWRPRGRAETVQK
jgi:sugar lactone lactonase YvrE